MARKVYTVYNKAYAAASRDRYLGADSGEVSIRLERGEVPEIQPTIAAGIRITLLRVWVLNGGQYVGDEVSLVAIVESARWVPQESLLLFRWRTDRFNGYHDILEYYVDMSVDVRILRADEVPSDPTARFFDVYVGSYIGVPRNVTLGPNVGEVAIQLPQGIEPADTRQLLNVLKILRVRCVNRNGQYFGGAVSLNVHVRKARWDVTRCSLYFDWNSNFTSGIDLTELWIDMTVELICRSVQPSYRRVAGLEDWSLALDPPR